MHVEQAGGARTDGAFEDREIARVVGPRPEVAAALARLKRREREALALRFGGDLRTAEVAQVLDISVANAQQILSRELRRLRELMEEGSTGTSASLREGTGSGDPDSGEYE